ncbi:thermonuclease family protein [Pseudomonas sp. S4_EA_1b]|uniref:thermonuclease family protein n=1 Tax=Pseudomonas sp. S4_EA_1b TaxID=2796960 RepID=UPI0018E64FF3|nr:thermonuclease family protein [Pseudomonas sp. S4_EA_1b]MBI6601018.1 thermonuclease family protein [Pseudomonas sp. S4_EA_1b]
MRSVLIATGLCFVLVAPFATAEEISCMVVGISDGDTFTCLTSAKRQVKVRLAELDTPESKQPYGTRARQALSQIAFGKDVTLKVKNTDRYGRTVARAFVGDEDINAHLVSSGAAWVYRQYSKDRGLLALESAAREARVGLWALPESERMPPWEWRRAARK